jgi:hypothetical protein
MSAFSSFSLKRFRRKSEPVTNPPRIRPECFLCLPDEAWPYSKTICKRPRRKPLNSELEIFWISLSCDRFIQWTAKRSIKLILRRPFVAWRNEIPLTSCQLTNE